jgi:hypothetical protein
MIGHAFLDQTDLDCMYSNSPGALPFRRHCAVRKPASPTYTTLTLCSRPRKTGGVLFRRSLCFDTMEIIT